MACALAFISFKRAKTMNTSISTQGPTEVGRQKSHSTRLLSSFYRIDVVVGLLLDHFLLLLIQKAA